MEGKNSARFLSQAWFTHFDAWDRRAQADARAWEAGKDLLKAKAKVKEKIKGFGYKLEAS